MTTPLLICPRCQSLDVESTTMGGIIVGPDQHLSEPNTAMCHQCRHKGNVGDWHVIERLRADRDALLATAVALRNAATTAPGTGRLWWTDATERAAEHVINAAIQELGKDPRRMIEAIRQGATFRDNGKAKQAVCDLALAAIEAHERPADGKALLRELREWVVVRGQRQTEHTLSGSESAIVWKHAWTPLLAEIDRLLNATSEPAITTEASSPMGGHEDPQSIIAPKAGKDGLRELQALHRYLSSQAKAVVAGAGEWRLGHNAAMAHAAEMVANMLAAAEPAAAPAAGITLADVQEGESEVRSGEWERLADLRLDLMHEEEEVKRLGGVRTALQAEIADLKAENERLRADLAGLARKGAQ